MYRTLSEFASLLETEDASAMEVDEIDTAAEEGAAAATKAAADGAALAAAKVKAQQPVQITSLARNVTSPRARDQNQAQAAWAAKNNSSKPAHKQGIQCVVKVAGKENREQGSHGKAIEMPRDDMQGPRGPMTKKPPLAAAQLTAGPQPAVTSGAVTSAQSRQQEELFRTMRPELQQVSHFNCTLCFTVLCKTANSRRLSATRDRQELDRSST